MADEEEKTEEPTGKKLDQAKAEGNVGKSAEVVGAAILLFGTVFLLFFSSFTFEQIKKMMLFIFSFIGEEINETTYFTITYTIVTTILYALAPFFVLVIFLTFVFNWMQFGMLLIPLKFDLQKLDPIKGIKGVFSLKKLIEAFKLMLKLTVIVIVMVILFLLTGEAFLAMMDKSIDFSINAMVELIIYFLAAILFIIILFAIIDFFFTKHYYIKSLRMSKQEIKDEYKNMEGDPKIKARIRGLQMKMAQERMMSNVPDADVVITNPTHYAVALQYDNTVDQAPKMVGKGIDFMALNIKDVAREHNIPIIENPALARALYNQLEIEQTIPEEFYKAIAEIFSYVYELKKKG
jgi:flagellar biosynthetic protein FlhB